MSNALPAPPQRRSTTGRALMAVARLGVVAAVTFFVMTNRPAGQPAESAPPPPAPTQSATATTPDQAAPVDPEARSGVRRSGRLVMVPGETYSLDSKDDPQWQQGRARGDIELLHGYLALPFGSKAKIVLADREWPDCAQQQGYGTARIALSDRDTGRFLCVRTRDGRFAELHLTRVDLRPNGVEVSAYHFDVTVYDSPEP